MWCFFKTGGYHFLPESGSNHCFYLLFRLVQKTLLLVDIKASIYMFSLCTLLATIVTKGAYSGLLCSSAACALVRDDYARYVMIMLATVALRQITAKA